MNGKNFKIMIASGTYNENIIIKYKLGGSVSLQGVSQKFATGQADDITINSVFIGSCTFVSIHYMDLVLNRTDGASFEIARPSYVLVYQCEKITINNNANKSNVGIHLMQSATLVCANPSPFQIVNTKTAIEITQGSTASFSTSPLTISNTTTGVKCANMGRFTSGNITNNASTRITTESGGRVLYGGNADTTNWRY